MTDKPELPPLTAEAFDAMLKNSALFQQMRDEIWRKAQEADCRLSMVESDLAHLEDGSV